VAGTCPHGKLECPGGELCVCVMAGLAKPDFKDAPRSLGEVRSDKSGKGSDWSPREALVCLLRDIDNGLNVDALVVCYRVDKDRASFVAAAPDGLTVLGLLSRISHKYQEG